MVEFKAHSPQQVAQVHRDLQKDVDANRKKDRKQNINVD